MEKVELCMMNNHCWHAELLKLTGKLSLQYPYIIQQAGNENTQNYSVEVAILIKHQILVTNLQGNV